MSRIDRSSPVPLPAEQLRIGLVLPFTLLDAEGRVLLAKGQRIEDEQQLRLLRERRQVFVPFEESELAVKVFMTGLLELDRRGGAIKDLDRYVQLSDDGVAKEAEPLRGTLPEQCAEVAARLRRLLAGIEMGGVAPADGPARFEQLWRDIGQLTANEAVAEASTLVLTYRACTSPAEYSVLHALQCAVLARQVAPLLKLSAEESRTLVLATASMNVAMLRLQDALAQQRVAPSPVQRAQIDAHAAEGERLLRAAGVADPLWLEAVRLHHTPLAPGVALAQRPPGQRLAHIVQVLDRYTAAMSPRASRPGRTAKDAARTAILFRTGGAQDEVGLALVQLLGLYPPGTFVRLTGGETAMVLRRGARAGTPVAAVVANRAGEPLGAPKLVSTARPEYAPADAVPGSSVRARINLDEMVKLLAFARTPGSGLR
ncbi:MAG: HD domain-containing protein [Tepidimonas fonticaldi]|nr:HD domain-containing protein [Tepidimonas fonticaldi]